MTTPDHWSFSQWSDFAGCGHRYRLRRIDGLTETPSVASVAGRAFHKWTELHDLGSDLPEWGELFEEAIEQEVEKTQTPRTQFRVGGRSSKAKPHREDISFWRFYGLELIHSYEKWYASTKWEIGRNLPPDDDGREVGIEYGFNVKLGGESFRGYADRISRNEKSELGIVDYKTGSRVRHTIQLGMYAAALARHGIRAHWGAYYDARKGEATEPVDLTSWTPERAAQVMAPQQFMRDNGIYPIIPGDHCDWCPVRRVCEYHL